MDIQIGLSDPSSHTSLVMSGFYSVNLVMRMCHNHSELAYCYTTLCQKWHLANVSKVESSDKLFYRVVQLYKLSGGFFCCSFPVV